MFKRILIVMPVLLVSLLLAACGDTQVIVVTATPAAGANNQTTTTAMTTTAATTAAMTTVPIATTAAVTTVAPTTAKSSSSSLVKDFQLVKAEGAGQELVGQTGKDDKFEIKVIGVDRVSEIKGSGKDYKSQGVFLIVQLELKNIGNKDATGVVFDKLVDSKGREFATTSNYDALALVGFSNVYKNDLTINPGFTGNSYQIFEVPVDATGFKLKIGF